MNVKYMDSPIGLLKIVSNGEAIVRLALVDGKDVAETVDQICIDMILWLQMYFSGACEPCVVPMKPDGTAFQQKVWSELRKIPRGTTVTYGELAARVGSPKASRAVGGAVGRNSILIAIPCHRVVSSSGLGGFSALGGTETKKRLLKMEKIL